MKMLKLMKIVMKKKMEYSFYPAAASAAGKT